ncbi:MAG: NADPH-dependent FMN reductase [Halorientalis sp.]
MQPTPSVVAICGSLRDASTTRTALEHVLDAADDAGAATELIDVRDWDLPVYDGDDRDAGDAVTLRDVVGSADAVVMGTPVYHGMVSSPLKTAFDYLGRDEFEDTTVGLLATTGGGPYAPTLEHLRTGVRTLHGWALPHEVGIQNARDAFDDDGAFVDPDLEDRVRTLGRMVTEYASIEAASETR